LLLCVNALQIRKAKSSETGWQVKLGRTRQADRQTCQWTHTSIITMCLNPEICPLIACALGTSFYSSLSDRERERERLSDDVISRNLRGNGVNRPTWRNSKFFNQQFISFISPNERNSGTNPQNFSFGVVLAY
jgi:hypothetical protein